MKLIELIRIYVEDRKWKDTEKIIEEDSKDYSFFKEILEEAVIEFDKEYNSSFDIKDTVKVKKEIKEPKYSWGPIDHKSIGAISDISDKNATINFTEHTSWRAYLPEMEIVKKAYEPFKDLEIPKINSAEGYEIFKEVIPKTIKNANSALVHKINNLFSNKIREAEEKRGYKAK